MSSAVREEEVPLLSQDEIDRINTLILGGRKKGEDVDTRQPKAVELKTAELIRKLDDSRRSGVSSSQGSGSSSDITYHSDASLDSYQSAHSRSQESDSGASVYTARSRESDGSHRERAGSSSSQKTKDSHNKGEAHGKNPR